MKHIILTLLKSADFIRLSLVGCLLLVAMPVFVTNAQSGSISFDAIPGCIIQDNTSECTIDFPQKTTPGYNFNTIGGTFPSKNTTGDYLLVKNLSNPRDAYPSSEGHFSLVVLPADGSLGSFRLGTIQHPARYLTHGDNTIVFLKPDGTETSRQIVQATCNPGSEWKVYNTSATGGSSKGECIPNTQTTGKQVTSFTATDCVIALGDGACRTELEATSVAGRRLQARYTNADAYTAFGLNWIIGETGTDQYNKGAQGYALPAVSSDPTKYRIYQDPTEFIGIRATDDRLGSSRVDGFSHTITYGLNKFTLYESLGTYSNEAKAVGTATARATCAPGTVWTRFDYGVTNVGEANHYTYKCVPPVVSGNTKPQKIEMLKIGIEKYGDIKGYCPVGQTWQLDPNYNDPKFKNYTCQPNIEPIDTSKFKVSLDLAPDLPSAKDNGCNMPHSIAQETCLAIVQITAPPERTFTLMRTSEPMYEDYVTKIKGKLSDITQMSYEDPTYRAGTSIRDPKGPGILMHFNKPNVYEVRLGSTILAKITATASPDGTVPCSGVTCTKYKWDIKTTYGNSGTPVAQTPTASGTPGTTNTPIPPGCASALYNSAYALANCPDGVGTIGAPVSASTGVGTGVRTNLTESLFFGSRGSQVEALQRFLVSQNLLSSDSVTGFFGPATQEAVQKYQCARNIVCTGTPDSTGYGAVGPSTRSAINGTNVSTGTTGTINDVGTNQTNSSINALIQSLLKQVQALMVQLQAMKAAGN